MNIPSRLFLLAAGLLAVAGPAYSQGNEIYTWTDENGVVHYVDTVPDNPDAQKVEAPEAYMPGSTGAYPDGQPADSAAANSPASVQVSDGANPPDGQSSQNGGGQEENLSYAEQKRQQIARNREERLKREEERSQQCERARAEVATLEPTRRVYFTNDEGETERMDDEVRVKMVEEAKARVAEFCD